MAAEMAVLFLIREAPPALVVRMRVQKNPVAFASLVAFALIVLLGLIPASGAKLGGLPLQGSASGRGAFVP